MARVPSGLGGVSLAPPPYESLRPESGALLHLDPQSMTPPSWVLNPGPEPPRAGGAGSSAGGLFALSEPESGSCRSSAPSLFPDMFADDPGTFVGLPDWGDVEDVQGIDQLLGSSADPFEAMTLPADAPTLPPTPDALPGPGPSPPSCETAHTSSPMATEGEPEAAQRPRAEGKGQGTSGSPTSAMLRGETAAAKEEPSSGGGTRPDRSEPGAASGPGPAAPPEPSKPAPALAAPRPPPRECVEVTWHVSDAGAAACSALASEGGFSGRCCRGTWLRRALGAVRAGVAARRRGGGGAQRAAAASKALQCVLGYPGTGGASS